MIIGYDYDARIDIWSVGCILAELLGRGPLFAGKDFMEILLLNKSPSLKIISI